MASHAKTRARIVDQIRYRMEDFTKWKVPEVAQWLKDVSVASPILEKELKANLSSFAYTNGSQLNKLDDEMLACMELSYNSRFLLLQCIKDLQDNEALNTVRRKKANKLTEAFRTSDADGSGTLEKDEIREIVRQTFPETSDTIVNVYFEVLLRECDKENKGKIILDEFLSGDQKTIMMKIMAEAEAAEVIEANFNAMDVDGSGELDKEELRALIAKSFPDAGPTKRNLYFNKIVKEIDKNNDGTVTLPEFISSEYISMLRMEPAARKGLNGRCVSGSPKRSGGAEISLGLQLKPSLGLATSHLEGQPGDILLEKAEEALDQNVNGWDDAQELFTKAGATFAEAGQHIQSAQAYQRASDCFIKLLQTVEAADTLVLAAQQFRSGKAPDDAIECLLESAEIFKAHGRPRMAAKFYTQVADIVIKDQDDPAAGVDWLEKASQHFTGIEQFAQKIGCLRQMLPLYGKLEMWPDARAIAEKIAVLAGTDNLGPTPTLGKSLEWEMRFWVVLLRIVDLDCHSERVRAAGMEQVVKAHETYVSAAGANHPLLTMVVRDVQTEDKHSLALHLSSYTEGKELEEWITSLFATIDANMGKWLERKAELKRQADAEAAAREVVVQEVAAKPQRRKITRAALHPC